MRFIRQFHNLLIYVLIYVLIAAGAGAGAGALAAAIGHVTGALVVMAVVLVNATIGMIQEGRAEMLRYCAMACG